MGKVGCDIWEKWVGGRKKCLVCNLYERAYLKMLGLKDARNHVTLDVDGAPRAGTAELIAPVGPMDRHRVPPHLLGAVHKVDRHLGSGFDPAPFGVAEPLPRETDLLGILGFCARHVEAKVGLAVRVVRIRVPVEIQSVHVLEEPIQSALVCDEFAVPRVVLVPLPDDVADGVVGAVLAHDHVDGE